MRLLKTLQKYCACHTKQLSTRYKKRLKVTKSTRNEAKRRWKPPKVTPVAELAIRTAIRPSRGRLRTVADGCERSRTIANINATSSEQTLNPQTPRVKWEPLLRSGKNISIAVYCSCILSYSVRKLQSAQYWFPRVCRSLCAGLRFPKFWILKECL